jgi:nucleoside-diphosphate-sugar epimerase
MTTTSTLEGDIARLLVLAKDMRACTIVNDAERRARIARTRVADGLAVNLGEPQTMPVGWWLQQILIAAGSDATLVRVSDLALPGDLAITAALAQHLLVSVARAQALLDWAPGDPATRTAESVHWHLEHPPSGSSWSEQDTATDDAALASAPA